MERLSEQLGKQVEFRLVGGEVLLGKEARPVIHAMAHLVRNAIDHGIEAKGWLEISFATTPTEVSIAVRDGGRGIDPESVARLAVERGLLSKEEADRMSRDQKLRLIFVDGLSSAAQVTDISGRGVGMGALLRAVDECGGRIEIDTELGLGTAFTAKLPLAPAS